MTSRRELERRIAELEDDVRTADAPEAWMHDLPRELWDDPEEAWRWCLRTNRGELADRAHFRTLKAYYGYLDDDDPAVASDEDGEQNG